MSEAPLGKSGGPSRAKMVPADEQTRTHAPLMLAPYLNDAKDLARRDDVFIARQPPAAAPPVTARSPVTSRGEPIVAQPVSSVKSADIPPMDGSETREQRECRVLRAQVRRLERSVTLARDDARMATRREHTAVANLALATSNLERERGRLERACEARIDEAAKRAKDEGAAARLELKRRVENRERANANLRERIDEARAALRDARAHGEAAETDARDVARERDDLAARINALEADLAATSRRLDDTERALRSTVASAEARTRALDAELARERARGEDARAKLGEATERISSLDAEVAARRAAAEAYTRRITQAEERTRGMERKVTHVRSRLADRERDLANAAKARAREMEKEAERRREFESARGWFDAQMSAMRGEHARLMALVKRFESAALPDWMS